MSEQPAQTFTIERVYLKDMSLEIPNAPEVFTAPESPQVDIRMHNEARALAGGQFEVVLTVTITAKLQEKTAFLIEVAQAGVFQILNFSAPEIDAVVNVTCPRTLLPYAREAISGVLSRAGFPPVTLPHVGFESLYQQRMQEREQQQAPAGAPPQP